MRVRDRLTGVRDGIVHREHRGQAGQQDSGARIGAIVSVHKVWSPASQPYRESGRSGQRPYIGLATRQVQDGDPVAASRIHACPALPLVAAELQRVVAAEEKDVNPRPREPGGLGGRIFDKPVARNDNAHCSGDRRGPGAARDLGRAS